MRQGPGDGATAAAEVAFHVNDDAGTRRVPIPGHARRLSATVLGTRPVPGLFRNVHVKGGGNTILLGEDVEVAKLDLKITGHGNQVIIGSGCRLKGIIGILGRDRVVFIGAHTTFNNVAIICKHGGHVYIGRDCMFSSGIEVRTSDSHAVIDTERREIVNAPAGVFIGDHVWVGKDAVVQKGAVVGDDNVIAMSAFVRGAFPESNTIIAGAPAKVVRRNRTWARDELVDPASDAIFSWRSYGLM